MGIIDKGVTTFECVELDAESVSEATRAYENLINRHMADPRCKYFEEAERHLYMKPIKYDMKMIDGEFIAEITFIGTKKSKAKLPKQS